MADELKVKVSAELNTDQLMKDLASLSNNKDLKIKVQLDVDNAIKDMSKALGGKKGDVQIKPTVDTSAIQSSMQSAFSGDWIDKSITKNFDTATNDVTSKLETSVRKIGQTISETQKLFYTNKFDTTLGKYTDEFELSGKSITTNLEAQTKEAERAAAELAKSKSYLSAENDKYRDIVSKAFLQTQPLTGKYKDATFDALKQYKQEILKLSTSGSPITSANKDYLLQLRASAERVIKEQHAAQYPPSLLANNLDTNIAKGSAEIEKYTQKLQNAGNYTNDLKRRFEDLRGEIKGLNDNNKYADWNQRLKQAKADADKQLASAQGIINKNAYDLNNKIASDQMQSINSMLSNQMIGEGQTTGITNLRTELQSLQQEYAQVQQQLSAGNLGADQFEQVKQHAAELDERLKQCQKTASVFNDKIKFDKASSGLEKLNSDFEIMQKRFASTAAEHPELKAMFDDFAVQLANADVSQLDELKAKMTAIGSAARNLRGDFEPLGQTIRNSFGGFGTYITSMFSAYRIIGYIRKAISSMVSDVKALDSSLVEFQKVSGMSGASLDSFTQQAYETGKQLGRTGKDVIDATTTFSRAGYDLNESNELAKAALVMTNIGADITSTADAASYMISFLQAYNIEAQDAMSVIDKLYNVSNLEPIDFGNIVEGLRTVGGTLAQSGTSIEESMALITGGFATLRDVSSVSSGLIMISQRLRGVSEDGEEVEGLVPKLEKEFKRFGISLRDQDGELRSTFDILNDLSGVWGNLSSMWRQKLGSDVAGTRQVKVLNALMQNWDVVQGSVGYADTADGTAAKGNELFQQSIEGRINIFKSAMQELSQTTLSSDFIKGFIDAGTAIVNLTTQIGGLQNVVAPLMAGVIAFKWGSISKGLSSVGAALKGIISFATGAGTGLSALSTGLIAFAGVAAAIAAINGIKWLSESDQRAIDAAEKASSEAKENYQSEQGELDSLNEKLAETQSLMTELEGHSLTIVEKAQYDELSRQNAELERQIALQEQITKISQREAAETAVTAYNTRMRASAGQNADDGNYVLFGLQAEDEYGISDYSARASVAAETSGREYLEMLMRYLPKIREERDEINKQYDQMSLDYDNGVIDFDTWFGFEDQYKGLNSGVTHAEEQLAEYKSYIDGQLEGLQRYENPEDDVERAINDMFDQSVIIDAALLYASDAQMAVDHIISSYSDQTEDLQSWVTKKSTDAAKKMQKEFGGGNVDLAQRPQIPSAMMNAAGYTDVEEGTFATLYSSFYTDEAGQIGITITPILPDGSEVLSPADLDAYVSGLFASGDILGNDEKGLVISVDEKESNESIDEFIDRITKKNIGLHEAQESFFETGGMNEDAFAYRFPEIANAARSAGISLADVIHTLNLEYNDSVSSFEEQIDMYDEIASHLYSTTSGYEMLTAAMKEQSSSGLLTAETIKKIVDASDELASVLGPNTDKTELLSSMLESTAQGYRLNADAVYEYLEQANEDSVSAAMSELRKLYQQLAEDPDNQGIQNQISMYSALIQEIESATGALARYKAASSTQNQDADYQTGTSIYKQIQEGNESGKIGTDDYKEAVGFILGSDWETQYASDLSGARKRAEKIAKRYFGQDDERQGMLNAADDLVEAGHAFYDESGQFQLAEGFNMESAAESLGITEDALRSLFGLMEAYGSEFDFPEVVTEEDERRIDNYEQRMKEMSTLEEQIAADTAARDAATTYEEKAQYQERIDAAQNALDEIQGLNDIPVEAAAPEMSIEDVQAKLQELGQLILDLSSKGIDIPMTLTGEFDRYEQVYNQLSGQQEYRMDVHSESGEVAETFEQVEQVESTVQGAQDAHVDVSSDSSELSATDQLINSVHNAVDASQDIRMDVKSEHSQVEDAKAAVDDVVSATERPQMIEVGVVKGALEVLDEEINKERTIKVKTEVTVTDQFGNPLTDPIAGTSGESYNTPDLSQSTPELSRNEAGISKAIDMANGIIESVNSLDFSGSEGLQQEARLYTDNLNQALNAFTDTSNGIEDATAIQNFIDAYTTLRDFINNSYETSGITPDVPEVPATGEAPTVTADVHAETTEFKGEIEEAAEESEPTATVEITGVDDEGVEQTVTYTADDSGIQSVQDDVNNILSATQSIDMSQIADPSGLSQAMNEVARAGAELQSALSQASTDANFDTGGLESAAQSFVSAYSTLNAYIGGAQSMTVNVDANTSPAQSAINAIQGKTVTVTVVTRNVQGNAKGTKNAKPGLSLVDEKGAELIEHVSQGTFEMGTNKGARFTTLNKGDVVHTAAETRSILSRAGGAISSIAGAFRNGWNQAKSIIGGAFATGGTGGGGWTRSSISSKIKSSSKSSSKTSSKRSGSSSTRSSDIKDYVENLVDWVEVRIDSLKYIEERYEEAADEAIGFINKNKQLNDALDTTANLLIDAQAGYERYLEQAQVIAEKSKLSADIIEKIQDGTIDIEEYDETTRNNIKYYQTWLRLATIHSDVYSKSYLIAGKPLEPHKPQRDDEIDMSAMVKKYMWIGQSAAKLRTGERSTTNCRMASYRSFEMVCPINSYIGEDIVWSHAKV